MGIVHHNAPLPESQEPCRVCRAVPIDSADDYCCDRCAREIEAMLLEIGGCEMCGEIVGGLFGCDQCD